MKRCSFLVLLVLGLSLNVSAKSIPDTVGIWTFDNIKGDTVIDDSGNGNDGKILEKAEIVNGKFGKAIKLNGSNQCVEVPDSDSLDITDEITMMCWFNWDGAGDGWQTFFSKGPMSGTNENWALFINTASGYFHFILTPGGARVNTDSPNGVVKKSEWQFVAATWDGKNINYYLDGKMIKESPLSGKSTPNTNILRLGHREAATHWWMGLLDEMAVFNKALSEDQVNAIMKSGLVGFMAVEAKGKLSTAWGEIKSR
ncbi:MAG: LamG domain-containing protein [Patescibacteria group bacterium]